MKKLIYLSFLLFTVSILTTSCNKDDDDSNQASNNEFTLDGTTYSLANGYIQEFGSNGNGSFDWDVYLASSGLTVSGTTGFSGSGDYIYLDLDTNSETGLVAGTYNYASIRDAFTFTDADVTVGFESISQPGTTNSVTGGTIEIELDGGVSTITFNLTLSNGNTVEGNYTGTLETI